MRKCIEYLRFLCAGCVALLTLLALDTSGASSRLHASAAAISRHDARSFLRRLREDVVPAGGARCRISPEGNSLMILSKRGSATDTVVYSRGSCGELAVTPNPADFPIFRRKSGEEPEIFAIGAVDLSFRAVAPGAMHCTSALPLIQIDLATEPPFPVSGRYDQLAFHLTVHQE